MHNTGNDIESNDILDFEDNTVNLDILMNADQEYWTDRLGNKRPTIDYVLRMAGFTPAGFDFTTGGVLKNGDRNKCVFNQADQTWYSWTGDLPYNVIAGSVPGEGWKVVNRNALTIAREALRRTYQEVGLNLVEGSFEQGGVLTSPTDVLLDEVTGKAYSYTGTYPKTVPAGTSSGSAGFTSKVLSQLRSELLTGTMQCQAANIDDMIAGVTKNGSKVKHVIGQRWSTGPTSWEVLAVPVTTIDDFTTIGGYERCFSEFGGKGDFILYQLTPVARHLPFKTTNNITNPTPTDNSAAMATAVAAQKLYGFQLVIEPGHYYFTKKTRINTAFHISGRSRSAAQSYLQKSDVILYLDSPDSNESIFEFESDTIAQTNTNMQGSTLSYLFFKQVNQVVLNQHMIRCHNVGWSYSDIHHLTFLNVTGYCIYFMSDYELNAAPKPYQTTYFHNVDFTNFGFQSCGGTIGNDGTSYRIATKGTFRNWNGEGTINRVSPQPWYLNMQGMKDYGFDNVIMEGGDATGLNSIIKMGYFGSGGDIFRITVKGLWIEYLQNPVTFIIAGGVDIEFNNLNTAVPTAQANVANFISFTIPYSRAKFSNSNLYPWGANLCLFNGLENNISVTLENCTIRDIGEMLAGTVAKQSRYEFKNMLSSLGTKRVFNDFVTSVKMYEWDGVSTTGKGVVTLSSNAQTTEVVPFGGGEGNTIKLTRDGTFVTFNIDIALKPELIGQDVVVGYRLYTNYTDVKLAVYSGNSNYENVIYVNQTIADGDKGSFVNCYAILGNIKQATVRVGTLPTIGAAMLHDVWISDIIVSVGKTIFQMLPGRV